MLGQTTPGRVKTGWTPGDYSPSAWTSNTIPARLKSCDITPAVPCSPPRAPTPPVLLRSPTISSVSPLSLADNRVIYLHKCGNVRGGDGLRFHVGLVQLIANWAKCDEPTLGGRPVCLRAWWIMVFPVAGKCGPMPLPLPAHLTLLHKSPFLLLHTTSSPSFSELVFVISRLPYRPPTTISTHSKPRLPGFSH